MFADTLFADTSETCVSDASPLDSAELNERHSDGISVSLNYNRKTSEVWAYVSTPTQDFTLREIPSELASDVFTHPMAYAARILPTELLAGILA